MLSLEPYLAQQSKWPATGRHVLAQFDDESVIVYQAFRPAIASEAVRLGRFGASFSRGRMSWIKPNFLWMMYRCGWATKVDQERVLAVRIERSFFERLLRDAVPSSFDPARYTSREAWQDAVRRSEVRLQWDPDHDPSGNPVERRAIQLGLRGATLATYAGPAIVAITDATDFVVSQRVHARGPYAELVTPSERVLPLDAATATAVRCSFDA